MVSFPPAPFSTERPWGARLSPAGAPDVRVVSRAGATVVALPNRYSVTYLLLAQSSVAVVDVGSCADVPRVMEALRWLGRTPSQVSVVVASHLHCDHVMGIDTLARKLGTPVAVGRAAFESIRGGPPLRYPDFRDALHLVGGWVYQGAPAPSRSDWPDGPRFGFPNAPNPFQAELLPLTDGARLSGLPGWTILETPGHADDAIALYNRRAGFLVTGDTVRNFLGGEWNPLQVDRASMQATIATLQDLPVHTVFPGHGPVLEGIGVLRGLKVVGPWEP